MASVAAAPGRSLFGKASAALSALSARKPGKSRRVAAVVAVAREHVVTFAALASVDIGAFHGGQVAGWVVTGLSLLAADFAVRG